ncbi:DNA-binding transcriptional MocR family regulator [Chitinivorax tropicus]|uniref:DNA-binding transcriptional MocR family regulator n=1 Tax=Chitinivorax tropicus TaxID=714531 RepID=A0A840MS98_9PROT|nr:PLP-dependent aminotransferase family protein [Chitinivorax tropicus]MBB5018091.1 DNA-binding transcriptional MocR family regulator [Chitinivorax tropicus]
MDTQPLYRRLANRYLDAIKAGSLARGDKMPSVRELMRLHDVSLTTALQLCRHLENEGWLEARPRSGYFVRHPRRLPLAPTREPNPALPLDPAAFVGIQARVSHFVAQGQRYPIQCNLSGARGAPSLYPHAQLNLIASRLLRKHRQLLVSAGTHSGNMALKVALARRAVASGMTLAPTDILVTHGCIEALNLALRAVTKPGDTIAVESPTFYGLLQVLESLGLRALEIPTSPQTGLSIDALELAIRSHDSIKAVVVVPHLQNPLGSIMPDAHKQRLVELCMQQGIPLIEDDTYTALTNSDIPLLALKHWDKTGNVIHCASLHKTLAPGMRLGWIAAGRWHDQVEMLKYAQSRHNEEWSQLTAAEFMNSAAYDRHLRRLRHTLRAQREQMAEAVAQYFPAGTRLVVPEGGLMLWVELPEPISGSRLFEDALQAGILIAPGTLFSNLIRFETYIRLNCGLPFTTEVEHTIRRLGKLAENHLPR